MGHSRIGANERAFYKEHGYVVVRRLFDDDEIASWTTRFIDIVEGRVEPDPHIIFMRDIMIVTGAATAGSDLEATSRIQFFEHDPVFSRYLCSDTLLDCIEALIGPDLLTINNMFLNKPPHVDGRHPLHQDLLYFPFRPPEKIVGTWTALGPATRESGCLVVVPGTHTGPLRMHADPGWEHVNRGYYGVKGMGPDTERVHMEMEPGDTVFFHPLLVHGSGRNRTPGFRRAISAHFASLDCSWEWADKAVGRRPYYRVRGSKAPEGWSLPDRRLSPG